MSLPNIIILLVNMLQILMKRRLPQKPRELGNGNRRAAVAPCSCSSSTFQSRTAKGRETGGHNTVGRSGKALPSAGIPRPCLPGLGLLSSHEPGTGVCDPRLGTMVGWLSTCGRTPRLWDGTQHLLPLGLATQNLKRVSLDGCRARGRPDNTRFPSVIWQI